MSCTCTKLQNVARCTDTLTIGTYGSASGVDVRVIFKTATGRIDVFDTGTDGYSDLTTGEDGVIVIDAPWLRTGTPYDVWVNLPTDSIETKRTFSIGETEVECANVTFLMAYDGNASDEIENETFTIAT